MFNNIKSSKRICNTGSLVWSGEYSYIEAVRWDMFINNINSYIEKAYNRQENIDDYDIRKELNKKNSNY